MNMKICFVVEDIYPALADRHDLFLIHGRAIHLKNLGEGLSGLGYEVSFITMDYGQPAIENIGKFKVYKIYRPNEGVPGLRFLSNKIPKILKAMKKVDAEIYLFMCAESLAGIVSWFCKKNNKIFVYYGASNKDFEINPWGTSFYDNFLYKRAIREADLLLCQNGHQLKTLKESFDRSGEILYNPMGRAEHTYDSSGNILWVANFHKIKRPELFIELSKRIDDKFEMIGGRSPSVTKEEYDRMVGLGTNKNVYIRGPLSYKETDRAISGSKLLVNTSESEGLSNTFLQAWRRGIPVVSFVDPDDMIKKYRLGELVNSFEEMVAAVEKIRKGISREHSIKIKEYFDKAFATEIIASRFDELLRNLI